jgi:hypothetical protein
VGSSVARFATTGQGRSTTPSPTATGSAHVITRSADVGAALLAAGFVEGVDLPPNAHSARKMHELAPVLLHAFDAP